MERRPNGTIVADASDDLSEIAAAMESGETLAISPGVYRLERLIVVDKGVRIKSLTNDARDVTIVRAGSTALLVKDGNPLIENLTFASTPASSCQSADAWDEVGYLGCVAIYGGSPSFVGCRATSAERSGFFVRGSNTTARLSRCEARLTGAIGIYFDEGASGVVEDCVFADNDSACVAVKQTPQDKWVDIVRTKMLRGARAAISVFNGARVRASYCEACVDKPLRSVVSAVNCVFAARSCNFYGVRQIPEGLTFDRLRESQCAFGITSIDSKVWMEDCDFERLIAAFTNCGRSSLTMKRCKVADGLESVVHDPNSPEPLFEDCDFFTEPIVLRPWGDGAQANGSQANGVEENGRSKGNEDESKGKRVVFGEESHEANDRVSRSIAAVLGSDVSIPVSIGNEYMNGYLYPCSRYGGTFVVSKFFSEFQADTPSNYLMKRFELAFATRMGRLKEGGFEAEKEFDAFPKQPSRKSACKKPMNDADDFRFRDKIADLIVVMTYITLRLFSGARVNRYDAIVVPDDYPDRSLAGRCFIIDTLGAPRDPNGAPSGSDKFDPREFFEYDVENVPENCGGKWKFPEPDDFGLLLAIEVCRSEMEDASDQGGVSLVARLKDNKYWPFSDLDRKNCAKRKK